MAAHRAMNIILYVITLPSLPFRVAIGIALGILVSLFFSLPLSPVGLVWILVFLGPLPAESWLAGRSDILRNLMGFIRLPWTVAAWVFVVLIPATGEHEGRAAKLPLVECRPFSREWRQFTKWTLGFQSMQGQHLTKPVLVLSQFDPLKNRSFARLVAREPLDANA